jgi:SAM-dependent methyltransferase
MAEQIHIDVSTSGLISGWARNTDYPNLSVEVDLFCDGQQLARVIANEYRANQQGVGIGNGTYGFSYVPSSPIVTDPRRISAVIVGFHYPKNAHQIGPLPPTALRARVAGTEDEHFFNGSGQLTVHEWMRALSCFNVTIDQFDTVVDFGCGCGRALRHLETKLTPHQRLIGMDVDQEAIDWLSANYPKISAIALKPLPPTPLDDASVDLVLSHSVFTHLPEHIQFLWLDELARILKPGRGLITSIHGTKVIDEVVPTLGAGSKAFLEEINNRGFFYSPSKAPAEASLPEYYGSAFHTIKYICERWTTKFNLIGWLPVFALRHQDVLVLQKK